MPGQIPAYGEHFTRFDSVPDFEKDLGRTIYVSKRRHPWYIRSNRNSEKWFIFRGQDEIAGPFSTMTECGNRLIMALWELYGSEDEPRPNPLYGRRNKN